MAAAWLTQLLRLSMQLPQPPPAQTPSVLSRRADYRGWLAAKKAQWRRSREARKRKRLEAAAEARPGARQRRDAGGQAAAADVTGLFQQAAAAATAAHWQIVSVAPTAEPGAWLCCKAGRGQGLWPGELMRQGMCARDPTY